MTMNELSVVSFENHLSGKSAESECKQLVLDLHNVGIALIRDPRVNEADNEAYLRLGERYFAQPYEARIPDQHPELGFQVGVSPPKSEKPRHIDCIDFQEAFSHLPPGDWPTIPPLGFEGDPKERFFWQVGPRPARTQFPKLNAGLKQVIPKAFASEWPTTMDRWGNQLLDAHQTTLEMLAVGLGLPPSAFTEFTRDAPHLLAANGMNLSGFPIWGIINAGHYDLNGLSVHGKANVPGLRVWTRNGSPMLVKVPDGCLLVQVGRQLQWRSAGYFFAGFHEVIFVLEAVPVIDRMRVDGRPPIRVSSTFFGHDASDALLAPYPHFLNRFPPRLHKRIVEMYPPMDVGDQVNLELKKLGFLEEEKKA